MAGHSLFRHSSVVTIWLKALQRRPSGLSGFGFGFTNLLRGERAAFATMQHLMSEFVRQCSKSFSRRATAGCSQRARFQSQERSPVKQRRRTRSAVSPNMNCPPPMTFLPSARAGQGRIAGWEDADCFQAQTILATVASSSRRIQSKRT